jgi:hypothetical protein
MNVIHVIVTYEYYTCNTKQEFSDKTIERK